MASVLLLIIFFVIVLLFTFPMSIFCGYQLNKHWNSQFIIKRHRKLILLLYILWCFHSFLEFPSLAIRMHNRSLFSLQPLVIMDDFSFFTRCLSIAIFSMRLYLMYYDDAYTRALAGDSWRILIDPSVEKTNWFLVNRRYRFGNTIFLLKWLIFILIFYSIIYCLAIYYFPHSKFTILFLMQTIWSMTAIGIAVYFWRKYPQSIDSWSIRKEIALICKIYFVAIGILVLLIIFDAFIRMDIFLLISMVCIAVEIVMFGLFYALVAYPVRVHTSITDVDMLKDVTIEHEFGRDWKDIVQTKEGYEAFADFLQNEWSIENLLFVTEYMQLKNVLFQKQHLRKIVEDHELTFALYLPDTTPMSMIVKPLCEVIHNEHIENALVETIEKLYEKYVDSSAALEVNVTSRVRNNLTQIFDRKEDVSNYSMDNVIEMMLMPMEATVSEVMELMTDSYMRFKGTETFRELIKKQQSSRKIEI